MRVRLSPISKAIRRTFGPLALGFLTIFASAQTDLTALPAEVHTYKTVADRELKLWVAKPADWQAADHRPAIVFFHGGGWTAGRASQFAPHSRHLAALGMVAVCVEYRYWDKAQAPTPDICVHDARSALRWVFAHATELGIDPKRIAAGGGSAGGHLAACTALDESYNDPAEPRGPAVRPQALVLLNPAVNLAESISITDARRPARERLSPSFHLTAAHPPVLIMVGEHDTTTLPKHDEVYVTQLKALGVHAELKIYPGQTHGFFNYKPGGNPWYDATLADMDQFLADLGWIELPQRR